jgi:hypothetical protein
MAGPARPFLFCRYSITVGNEALNPTGQFAMLSELQGRPVAHGERAEEEENYNTLLMRPKRSSVARRDVFTWSVGVTIRQRLRAKYDREEDRIDLELIDDGSVRYSDFVAVPSLSVLAVDDRGGELHLGGKAAINRFRSIIRSQDNADTRVEFEATPEEVRKALRDWSLTRVKFTLQPNNPRPVSRLAQALSDQFKRDGIGKLTGAVQPAEGAQMRMSREGFIAAAAGLADAGYGQLSVAGHTEDGLDAEIKKPRFDPDVVKNERIQEKPRELRVFIDAEDMNDEQVGETVARALIRFHRREEE